jgi:hypothetical protein
MVLKKDKASAETPQEAAGATKNEAEIITPQEETNSTATAKAAKEEQKQRAAKCFVYIGPNLPSGKLKGNTIFSGSREETTAFLADVLKDYPLVRDLIIPVEELAEQRVKAATPGNYINKCFKDVVAAVNAKK